MNIEIQRVRFCVEVPMCEQTCMNKHVLVCVCVCVYVQLCTDRPV